MVSRINHLCRGPVWARTWRDSWLDDRKVRYKMVQTLRPSQAFWNKRKQSHDSPSTCCPYHSISFARRTPSEIIKEKMTGYRLSVISHFFGQSGTRTIPSGRQSLHHPRRLPKAMDDDFKEETDTSLNLKYIKHHQTHSRICWKHLGKPTIAPLHKRPRQKKENKETRHQQTEETTATKHRSRAKWQLLRWQWSGWPTCPPIWHLLRALKSRASGSFWCGHTPFSSLSKCSMTQTKPKMNNKKTYKYFKYFLVYHLARFFSLETCWVDLTYRWAGLRRSLSRYPCRCPCWSSAACLGLNWLRHMRPAASENWIHGQYSQEILKTH